MKPDDTPIRPRRVTDETGRLLPITEGELRLRNAEAMKALEDIAKIGTQEEQRETLEFLAEAFGPERFRLY
jgi:hypothetical protein